MEKGKVFLNHCPPPLDTVIPDNHNLVFIKGVDTTNRDLYLGGRVEQCRSRFLVLGAGVVKVTRY